MNDGEITNEDLIRLSRIYVFRQMKKWLPGNISPTDIDGIIEWKKRRLIFEYKTEGTCVPTGQRLLLENMLHERSRDVLLVCSHPPLDRVEVEDIIEFSIWKYDQPTSDPPSLYRSPYLPASQLEQFIRNWFDFAEGVPNSFITNFRKACGVYPGKIQWD